MAKINGKSLFNPISQVTKPHCPSPWKCIPVFGFDNVLSEHGMMSAD